MNSGKFPRHARRSGVARWTGRIARFGSNRLRPDGDRQPLRPPVTFDPLIHPVAITEHCVIGDQIRIPAASCDMAGCGAAFADPAALGEADNRARAVVAGWAGDPLGMLLCPGCQQRDHATLAQPALPREAGITGDQETAGDTPRPGGNASPSWRSASHHASLYEVIKTRLPSGTRDRMRSAALGTRTQPWLTARPNTDGLGQPCTPTVPGPPP